MDTSLLHRVAAWAAAIPRGGLPIAVAALTLGCHDRTPERSRSPDEDPEAKPMAAGSTAASREVVASAAPVAGEPRAARPAPAPPAPPARRITFNGGELDPMGWRVLEQLEAYTRSLLPDGDYWYDRMSGVAGRWGGPAAVMLIPGLPLGGRLPAEASGGGSGRLTGIFVNGRELHPDDVRALMALYGQAWPGRWWVNGRGDFGAEGGPALGNLRVAATQARGGSWSRGWGAGSNSFWTGGDGNGYVWAQDGYSGCSFANDGAGVIC
jgi:hypothetical protein